MSLSSADRQPLRAASQIRASGERLLVVPAFAAGDRLDGFLARNGGMPDRSRAEWQRLIDQAAVTLNGQSAKPGQRVGCGDHVVVRRAAAQPKPGALVPDPDPDVPFSVVFQDPAMIVVDKPPGVVVHPAPGNQDGTLVNGLLARFPELAEAAADERPGIVHRLDQDTSGLLVVGRTTAATADLQRQMQRRSTEKHYLLLVRGTIAEDEGVIDAPIARDPRNRQRMSVRADGRPSETHFWVRERFGDFTLVDALLVTGRTHQLRVHFTSIGHPVAGDRTYASGRVPSGFPRQFVHSHTLRLRSPHDGREHTFTAELPTDLAEPLERLRRRARR